jgi:hypothetical protein
MKKYIAIALIFFITGALTGFLTGRKTITDKEVITYREGTPSNVIFELPAPKTETPATDLKLSDIIIPHYIFIPDSIDSIDLRPTVYDWNIERKYSELIDNEYGKLTIDATVQYNKLSELQTTFVPIYKEITRYREKTWQPFLSFNYSTYGYTGIGGGLFYKHWGFEYQYQRHFPTNKNGHLFGLKYKF